MLAPPGQTGIRTGLIGRAVIACGQEIARCSGWHWGGRHGGTSVRSAPPHIGRLRLNERGADLTDGIHGHGHAAGGRTCSCTTRRQTNRPSTARIRRRGRTPTFGRRTSRKRVPRIGAATGGFTKVLKNGVGRTARRPTDRRRWRAFRTPHECPSIAVRTWRRRCIRRRHGVRLLRPVAVSSLHGRAWYTWSHRRTSMTNHETSR